MNPNSRAILLITVCLILICSVYAAQPKRFPTFEESDTLSDSLPTYETKYFDQKVSHYNYKMTGKTYKQKYLIDTTNWNKSKKGAILFYCGNEGPI